MEAKVHTIDTEHCRFSYRDVGRGPVLLCLHGTGPGASGWGNYGDVAENLSRDFRLIIPDLPGFGKTEITRDNDVPWCRMAAQELVALLRRIEVEQVHIVGNSAGGTVALHTALVAPQSVKSLVLMGCAGLRNPLFSPRELEGPRLLRTYRPNPSLEKMKAIVTAFLSDPSILDVEAVAKARYEETLKPGGAAGAARMARDRPNGLRVTMDELASIKTQTLLIWGRDDRFVGVDDALQFLASMPNARLLLLSNCGHWVQVERQADFIAQVRAFANMTEGNASPSSSPVREV